MKTTINVTKQNVKDLKTSEYLFYLKGCSRPMTKGMVKEGLDIGALIIAVKRGN